MEGSRVQPVKSSAPSPLLALGVFLAGVLGTLSVMRGIFDPDYFWHFATGRLIAQTGAILRTDPFSFSWFGESWIPDQWLSDVLIYRLVKLAGANTGLLVFGFVAAVGISVLGVGLRSRGASHRSIALVSLLVAAVVLPQVTMRPQVLSLAMLTAVLTVLITAHPDRRLLLLILPPLFLLWANLHGFYVIGLGAGFVYLVATLLGRTAMSSARGWVIAAGVGSLLASMITPTGPSGILYSLSFTDPNDWGARNIAEWQSPNFHDVQFLPFLILIVVLLAFGNRGPGWLRFMAYVGLAMGLLAVRSIGVAGFMIMPTLVAGLDARLASPLVRGGRDVDGRRWIELAAAGLVAVVAMSVALVGAAGRSELSNDRFPVAGVAYLAEHDPDARVLTRYGWGGYVLNELYPSGGRVFADGRMHKYGGSVLDDYSTLVAADAGWEKLVDRYGVEALLLRVDTPLVRGPAQADGWCEAYRDDLQVLLLRSCA